MALSQKQQVWIEEYLQTWNATEAARRAGYAIPRISGVENLSKPALMEEIRRRVDERAMGADEVLVRLAEQARSEYSVYIDDDGDVDLAAMRRDGKMHLVKKIKPTRYGREVEFYDGQTALIQIGKHHQLFTEKLDLTADIEIREHESATERILSRIDSIAARIRQTPDAGGTSADTEGAGSA